MKMEEMKCEWCGKIFKPHPKSYRSKFCCRKCQVESQKVKKREQRKMRNTQTGKLDETLEEARAKGMTYAELQIARTLAMVRDRDEHETVFKTVRAYNGTLETDEAGIDGH